MARINVEDSIYKDPRFIDLIVRSGGCLDRALGIMVRTWTVAQEFYLRPSGMVPLKVWNDRRIPMSVVEAGLAEIVGDFVRVKGDHEQFKWLKQRSDAGRKNIEEFNQRPSTTDDGRPSSSSSSFSFSSSDSDSFSNSKTKTRKKPKSAIADVCPFDLESVYQKYPRKEGKGPGLKSLAKQLRCQSDFDSFATAVENYAKATAGRDTEHIKMFSSFVGSDRSDYPWREWVEYQPRQPMNKAEVQSSANVNALKTYLAKKGIEV